MTGRDGRRTPWAAVGCACALSLALCSCASLGSGTATGPSHGFWLTYSRTGSIAAAQDRIDVTADGLATITQKAHSPSARHLTSTELAALRHTLTNMRIRSLQREYENPTVRDGFIYEISYDGATVRCADGAVPASVAPVIQTLDSLLT